MMTNYTDETNTLLLVSLMKSHGIRWVIASPGATNVSFVASVQNDSYFKVVSVIDERSAAFMACGLAEETGEPVVLSCTGATASRNYIPGLTEAFYRHLPILAITSTLNTGRIGYYVPQLLDRSVQYTDMVKLSVQLPSIHSREELLIGEVTANKAILELRHRLPGPVHINLATEYSYDFSVKTLREYRVIKRITLEDSFPTIPNGKIGVFVGAHLLMTENETIAIDTFCKKHNAIVLCDQTSNYRGRYRVLANLANEQKTNISSKNFDLIIHIGYVSGAYISFNANEVWRVNPDGELRDLYGKLKYVFEMNEIDFFKHYSFGEDLDDSLIVRCNCEREKLVTKIGNMPFSNIWIAKKTAARLPDQAVLHLGILNSLRAWNFFETPATVACYSNTGGFGIDGCMSSIIGAAIAAPQKQFYLVLGGSGFFL